MEVLAENKRLVYLRAIAARYAKLYQQVNKEEKITIISAMELNDSEIEDFADAVKVITVEWVKIALIWQTCVNPISFWATETKAGNSRFDKDIILQEIKKSQENKVDIIVYNMHCGTEYTNWPNSIQK